MCAEGAGRGWVLWVPAVFFFSLEVFSTTFPRVIITKGSFLVHGLASLGGGLGSSFACMGGVAGGMGARGPVTLLILGVGAFLSGGGIVRCVFCAHTSRFA